MSTAEVFEQIYEKRLWGASSDSSRIYSSGSGSHDSAIVEPYIEAINSYFSDNRFTSALDLGCGDFNVGSRIASKFEQYIAADIVSAVIRDNAQRFQIPCVSFIELDATNSPLPPAEVVFLRQVLQHLSNADISKILHHISLQPVIRRLIVTEHLPDNDDFEPNIDKPTGGGTRATSMVKLSGVVLHKPPFNLPHLRANVLCSVPQYGARIVTTAYELK